jgi:hypothetical protein
MICLELVDEVLFEFVYFGYLISTKKIRDSNTIEIVGLRPNN